MGGMEALLWLQNCYEPCLTIQDKGAIFLSISLFMGFLQTSPRDGKPLRGKIFFIIQNCNFFYYSYKNVFLYFAP